MKKLNLGCGNDIRSGFVNADFIKTGPGVMEVDFNNPPYPFSDNEFDEIHCCGVLEHLGDKEKFRVILKEMIRITKSGGKWFITVPHQTSCSYGSEFHSIQFHWRSFYYRPEINPETIIYKDLEVVKRQYVFIKLFFWNFLIMPFVKFFPRIYEHTFLRYLFPCQDLYFEIKITK